MHTVVLVKQVPDTWSERTLRDDDRTVDREALHPVLNEMDEHGIEEALRLRDAHGGTVTALSMGPPHAAEALRKALAMGADRAVLVCDDALHGSCAVGTSAVLAAALDTLEFDLAIVGAEASDARVGALGAMLAERLGIAALTSARAVSVTDATARIERQLQTGYEVVEAALPAVVSVTEKINEPRYPSFKGLVAAKKQEVATLTLADLGVEPATVGHAGATSEVVAFAPRPPRGRGQIIADEGDGAARLAALLLADQIIEGSD